MVVNFTAGFGTGADPCTLPFTPAYQIQGSGQSPAITGLVDHARRRGRRLRGAVAGAARLLPPGRDRRRRCRHLGRHLRVQRQQQQRQPRRRRPRQRHGRRLPGPDAGQQRHVDRQVRHRQRRADRRAFPVASPDVPRALRGHAGARLPQTLSVTEHFQLGRFGQVVLSSDGRLQQPTNVTAPGAPPSPCRRRTTCATIILDDALQSQNPDPIVFARGGQPLSASNTLRGGDTATGIVGVLTYTWAGNAASGNAYRVRPVNALSGHVELRRRQSASGGGAGRGRHGRVVGMNLLNFFNTFARTARFGVGGPPDRLPRRRHPGRVRPPGARRPSPPSWRMRPDVLGVNEIENDGYGPSSALAVPGRSAECGHGARHLRVHRRGREHRSGQRDGHRRHQGRHALQAGAS